MVDSLSQLTFLNSDVKVMTVSLAQTVVPLSSPQQIFELATTNPELVLSADDKQDEIQQPPLKSI